MGTMRRGIVVAGRDSQVQVQFDDGLISPWLDVAQSSTLGKRSFTRFKKGELVRCYLDRKGESGEALYAIYNDDAPAIGSSDDVIQGDLPDGSSYIWEPGRLNISHASGASVTFAEGKIVIDGDVEFRGNVTMDQDLTVRGKADLQDTFINGIEQVSD